MLGLPDLQPLVQVGLELLFKCEHFVLLLGDQLGLGVDDLLLPFGHVLFPLFCLHLPAQHLHLVGLLITTFKKFLLEFEKK